MATLAARAPAEEREPTLAGTDLSRRPSRRRTPGVRRAWTISSGSSPRRGGGGPRREAREYSSLPRHRCSQDYPSLRASRHQQAHAQQDHGRHGHGDGPDQAHTDSGTGTQDEADLEQPMDLVRSMLERARRREDALKSVAVPAAASSPASSASATAGPVSLSLLGLAAPPCRPASGRRCPDPDVAGVQDGELDQPPGGAAAAAARSSLDGDDFRLVFISSDSSSRDEDEPRTDDDDDDEDDDPGDCLSTSSGGVGAALDDCDWDYFDPAVAARDDSSPRSTPTPIGAARRHRHGHARAFLDGSPSSSDCSSSGWAPRRHRGLGLQDWLAGLGAAGAGAGAGADPHQGLHQHHGTAGKGVKALLGGPGSGCCRSPQHGRRSSGSIGRPGPEAVGPVGPGPGPGPAGRAEPPHVHTGPALPAVVAGAGSAGPGTGPCASCGSIVPILVPIPVPVPVLVPLVNVQDAVPADAAMRPHGASAGAGVGRSRRKGGRGRRTKASTTSSRPTPAADPAGADGGRRVSRSSSVAEEDDNGVVLVTYRQIKDDAKQPPAAGAGTADDSKLQADRAKPDDASQAEPIRPTHHQVVGQEDEEAEVDGEEEKGQGDDSSCASTMSSDEDTNVDFDSEDDSNDEEMSRTYRLRDGATLMEGLRQDDSTSRSSSSRSSVSGEPGAHGDDSDGARQQPFRRVFVVNSSPSTSPTPEDDAGAARSKGAATALSAAPGDSAPPPPRADRCAPRPRDAPPPPPAAPAAPAPCDTSQVPSDARTEAGRPRAAVTDADASSAVGAAIAAVTTPADASPVAAAEKDKQDAAQHVPPGLSVDQPEPQDGMTSPSTAAQACRPSDTAEDADMFGAEPQHGDSSAAAVAAINKQVIGQVAPAELAALGGHLECLSVIESAAGAGAGAPVALRDILKESLQPEAEEARSRSRRGSATSTASSLEFSGTESMELSPSGDRDLEGEQQEVCGGGRQAEAAERETAEVGEEEGEERGDSGPVSPLARGAGADPELPQQRRPAPAPAPGEEPVTRRAPSDDEVCAAPKYTSLVMITPPESPVSVSVGPARAPAVTLSHTNFEEAEAGDEAAPEEELGDDEDDDEEEVEAVPLPAPRRARPGAGAGPEEDVQVVTGGQTLSAVICLEEGLADDDSWVEEVEPDRDADMDMEATATDTSSGDEGGEGAAADREEELRGYHRAAIDFTLHTILEESCEESEAEQRTPPRPRAPASSELEKYFFFDLGGGGANGGAQQQDAMSETNSSIYSEGLESLGTEDGFPDEDNPPEQADPAELASSRLEKYFLSGFMGFPGSSRRDSDGSVGSDSEGRPSPEQRRKRLVRARGTGRPAHSSQDNLAAPALPAQPVEAVAEDEDEASEDGSTTEDEAGAPEEPALAVDGQFDTVKRKKRKRSVGSAPGLGGTAAPASAAAAPGSAAASSDERDVSVSPALVGQDLGAGVGAGLAASRAKQHSRDSGFVGSCDDLLNKSASDSSSSGAVSPAGGPADPCPVVSESPEEEAAPENAAPAVAAPAPAPGPAPSRTTTPPATSLTRRDSFNNWSSDEETNLMMSKMRAFFKNMTAPSQVAAAAAAAPAAPERAQAQGAAPGPPPARRKPPQLVYFESELTRLMKTVPGIRDEQVRELVEYLSSEDTWSDSYDSSDYTSSDLEGAAGHGSKRALQEQISASCQQIITNFDTAAEPRPEDDVVYQRLMASLSRMDDRAAGPAGGGLGPGRPRPAPPQPQASPPIFAKVMQHIGGRLVALMHEVSGGQGGPPGAPRERYVHRRLQQKVSVASTTTEEDEDSVTDTEPDRVEGADQEAEAAGASTLARSRSHDLLGASAGLPHDHNADEREASDYERFSWRGSFESALMAADSRSRLSCGGSDVMSASVSTAAKRRSAGDLLYSHRSREHLDRVRSCGSIGGIGAGPAGPGAGGRRASVPDTSGGSADGDEDDDDDDDDDLDERGDDHGDLDLADVAARSTTLPRSLQATRGAGTNSLPRLPTSGAGAGTALLKMNAQGALGQVQSARYRPPGYSRQPSPSPSPQAQPALGNPPKRAMSAPGLGPHQPAPHPRRERRKHLQQSSQGEFSVAAIRGAELKLKGDESCPEASPRLSGPAPSPLSSRAAGAGAGAPGLSRAATLSSASSLKAAAAVRDWLPDDDILAGRLPALGGPLVSNLGRSDSLASVYSGAGEGRYGTVAVRGEVEFGLQYNYKQNALEIHVVQCRDLAPVDTKRNRSDPYVKVYLLPDKSKGGKRKTRVKKHTLNPYFDETLKFHISLKGLESRTLWLTVWHSDMFGRNDFLGEVMMGLENKVFDDPSPCFYTLQERTEPYDDVNSYRGDMIVALKFVPPDVSCSTLGKKGKRSSKGELHILVKEAKNLTANKASGSCDAFCKSYLLPDKGKSSKQKTAVIRRSCNPAWNHTFIYPDISLQELSERSLELTVWDHDRIASNEFLGGMRFNLGTGKHYGKPVDWMDSSGKELTLWQRMLERPNLWVESSIMLRPSLDRTAISSSSVT